MRKLIFFLLIFGLFCSTTAAYEDTIDRYQTDWTGNYRVVTAGSSLTTGYTVTINTDSLLTTNHLMQIHESITTSQYTLGDAYVYLVPNEVSYSPYFSYISRSYSQVTGNGGTGGSCVYVLNAQDNTTIATITKNAATANITKVEIVKNGDKYDEYENGVFIKSVTNLQPSYNGPVRYCVGVIKTKTQGWSASSADVIIDDLTDSSLLGVKTLVTEANDGFNFTWSAQLMRSYPDSYKISLYSLSNPDNAGLITSWNIPGEDNATTSEHGYIISSRSSLMGSNFGLYMLEMTRGADVLTDQYFYYDQLSNPQGFPSLLFLGTSSVKSDIRDENSHGGTISGGESVYLFPSIQSDGTYDFTYNILETPYAISTGLNTVYNTTSLNSTTVSYSGLSQMTYNISIDGALMGTTGGADTLSHTFTGAGVTNPHIISFSPDYSLAGVWGEVKNSETQLGIKSATVSISGQNFSKTLYTDDNGLFYLTKGLSSGQTYTITVSKTGYSTAPSQTAVTVEGSTTRQDFYLDKIPTNTNGAGLYFAPHDVGFTVLEYWYSGAGLTGVNYAIYNGTEQIKAGSTDSKGMFTGSDMSGGTNYTIVLTYNGKTYTEYVEPSQTEYTFVLNKEGILHQYANSWLNLTFTQNTNNVTVGYAANKTINGASLTAKAANGTILYSQTLNSTTGNFTFVTGGKGDYTLNFHIQASDGSTASQSWGLSYPDKIPLFPDSYPSWLKNVLFSGIIMVFLLAFGKSKNDVACGSVAILTSMAYLFGWFSGSFYFVVLVWIIALGAVFLHYKRTGGIG